MSHSTQICKVDQTANGKKNNSEYYYGDATPMLQGFTKTGGKKELVNNNDVTSEYSTKVPVDKTKGPVTTKMFVFAKTKGKSCVGYVWKISKHKRNQEKKITLRENCNFATDGKSTFSGWKKDKIAYTECKPIFQDGNFVRNKETKQWFKVMYVTDHDTVLMPVLSEKGTPVKPKKSNVKSKRIPKHPELNGFKKDMKVFALYYKLTQEKFAKKHFKDDWQTATITGTVLEVSKDKPCCKIRWHDGPMKDTVGVWQNASLTKANEADTSTKSKATGKGKGKGAGKGAGFCQKNKTHICFCKGTFAF